MNAKISIIAKHRQVVVFLEFRAAFGSMEEISPTAPQVPIQGHNQETCLRIFLDVLFTQPLAKLPPNQIPGGRREEILVR